jgi:hypothetical protein
LREIVEQIVGENLNGQHRQKGQEDAGAEHAEHIAEVRTRAHLNIFGNIAENLDTPTAKLPPAMPTPSPASSIKG